ncbi:MAG: type II toxin-antitoxin system VapC family toxin [Sphingomonas sp.]|nr:type II toxin-antitoxin system VapC family toxin [Sphingomonas sp.]
MFVDASALTAILSDEKDAYELLARLQKASERITSPLAVWETVIAVARNLGLEITEAHDAVEAFMRLAEIKVMPVSPETRAIAVEAYEKFGKSRHPAALNFGDCFAYAGARLARMPLLYKGDDFPRTDIETA